MLEARFFKQATLLGQYHNKTATTPPHRSCIHLTKPHVMIYIVWWLVLTVKTRLEITNESMEISMHGRCPACMMRIEWATLSCSRNWPNEWLRKIQSKFLKLGYVYKRKKQRPYDWPHQPWHSKWWKETEGARDSPSGMCYKKFSFFQDFESWEWTFVKEAKTTDTRMLSSKNTERRESKVPVNPP